MRYPLPAALVLCFSLLSVSCATSPEPEADALPPQPTDAEIHALMTTFLYGLMTGDLPMIETVIVPNPDAAVLVQREMATPDQFEEVAQSLQDNVYERLPPSTTAQFERGPMTDEERARYIWLGLVADDGGYAPVPYLLEAVPIDGQMEWRVNANLWINAFRNGADAES